MPRSKLTVKEFKKILEDRALERNIKSSNIASKIQIHKDKYLSTIEGAEITTKLMSSYAINTTLTTNKLPEIKRINSITVLSNITNIPINKTPVISNIGKILKINLNDNNINITNMTNTSLIIEVTPEVHTDKNIDRTTDENVYNISKTTFVAKITNKSEIIKNIEENTKLNIRKNTIKIRINANDIIMNTDSTINKNPYGKTNRELNETTVKLSTTEQLSSVDEGEYEYEYEYEDEEELTSKKPTTTKKYKRITMGVSVTYNNIITYYDMPVYF